MTDIDIDLKNRDDVLNKLKHIPASIIGNIAKKHNTGVYFHDMPHDPSTNLSTINYKEAEDLGYFKIDLLNVNIYEHVKNEAHLNKLLENIVLQTDLLDLKADHDCDAKGVILESRVDKGKGHVSTVIITNGSLKKGDFFVSGNTWGKIRAMLNDDGKNVDLALLSGGEKIDIDTYEDWNLCEYYLKRKHILFVVAGNNTVGLGHVYNTLLIANDILNHDVTFLLDKESELAFNVIKSKNFHVIIQQNDDILEDIKLINPDVIINDRLDTSKDYMLQLKKQNYKVKYFFSFFKIR